MKRDSLFRLILSIAKTQAAGIIGALFTAPAIATWYATLEKPALNPPNWIFGPVWTTLYLFMGISVFFVWSAYAQAPDEEERKRRRNALIVFDTQLALNVLWSILFFGLHSPLLAFIEIILLWCMIIWTIIAFWPISRIAAHLLIPYIAWVSFAGYLNYMLWVLN